MAVLNLVRSTKFSMAVLNLVRSNGYPGRPKRSTTAVPGTALLPSYPVFFLKETVLAPPTKIWYWTGT